MARTHVTRARRRTGQARRRRIWSTLPGVVTLAATILTAAMPLVRSATLQVSVIVLPPASTTPVLGSGLAATGSGAEEAGEAWRVAYATMVSVVGRSAKN
jgi:hypothetical protein